MFNSIFANLDKKIIELKRDNSWSSLKTYFLFVFSLVVIFVTPFLGNETLQLVLASLAGFGLFIGGYIVWFAGVSDNLAEFLAFRYRYNVFIRRRAVLLALFIWVVILVLLSRYIPNSILGGLSVTVFLTLGQLFSPTDDEKEETAKIENEVFEETINETIKKRESRRSKFFPSSGTEREEGERRSRFLNFGQKNDNPSEDGEGFEDSVNYDDYEDWDEWEEDDSEDDYDDDWDDRRRS